MVAFAVCLSFFLALAGYSDANYCVCNSGLSDSVLQKNMDYACGNGADCSPILENGPCFNPNTVKDHCNYAVNSYYQRKGNIPGSCDFQGTATVNPNPPSAGSGCVFPSSPSNVGGTTTPSTSPTTPGTPSTTTPSTSPTTPGTPSTTTPSTSPITPGTPTTPNMSTTPTSPGAFPGGGTTAPGTFPGSSPTPSFGLGPTGTGLSSSAGMELLSESRTAVLVSTISIILISAIICTLIY